MTQEDCEIGERADKIITWLCVGGVVLLVIAIMFEWV